ncbi:hypothetical protein TNIN_150831 [Trichonephila inaurata madagascariensis]|uniref:Uncharacterized protein n=1 Tax=Trichonephila inaurata madagascariensis TaxID=2747483 RepID=A0A8X6Y0T4_9ARAC|nr:hypothetical protein TNIN_150831 [Trichonephila inaurata madagascariensis]
MGKPLRVHYSAYSHLHPREGRAEGSFAKEGGIHIQSTPSEVEKLVSPLYRAEHTGSGRVQKVKFRKLRFRHFFDKGERNGSQYTTQLGITIVRLPLKVHCGCQETLSDTEFNISHRFVAQFVINNNEEERDYLV